MSSVAYAGCELSFTYASNPVITLRGQSTLIVPYIINCVVTEITAKEPTTQSVIASNISTQTHTVALHPITWSPICS